MRERNYLIVDGISHEVTDKKALTIGSWLRGVGGDGAAKTPIALAKHYEDCPWVQRCIRIRGNMISGIPWGVYRGDEKLTETSLAVDILSNVNKTTNYVDLMRATSNDMLIFGCAYWRLVGVKYGQVTRPKFIVRLSPLHVNLDVNGDGEMIFKVAVNGDGEILLTRDEVVYFHTYNPKSASIGLSPLASCVSDIETLTNAAIYTAKFFENGAIPALLVSVTGSDSTGLSGPGKKDVKLWQHLWDRKVKGAKNAGKTLFIGKNVKVNPVSLSLDKMALKEIKLEARRAICAALDVPMTMAGASEAANRATSQEQRASLYQEVVFPQAAYIEGVIDAELLPRIEPRTAFKLLINELPFMKKDEFQTAQRLSLLVTAGIITPDEAAIEMGYERLTGTETLPATEKKTLSDIDLWEKKVLKRVRAGKQADCKFTTTELTSAQQETIHELLVDAKNEIDVRRVFAFAEYP